MYFQFLRFVFFVRFFFRLFIERWLHFDKNQCEYNKEKNKTLKFENDFVFVFIIIEFDINDELFSKKNIY